MTARNGDYSGNIYREYKRYIVALLQQGVPLVDRDYNDHAESFLHELQRMIQAFGAQFAGADAWKVIGDGSTNNFKLDTDGAVENQAETWARGWVGGLLALLSLDRYFFPTVFPPSDRHQDELNHISVALGATTLTDSSFQFVTNELVGRKLYPNLADTTFGGGPTGFTILSNTANIITVSTPGDGGSPSMLAVAAVGDHYGIGLTTPSGADRTDAVFIDLSLQEWGKDQDPDLDHPIGPGLEAMRRLKIVQMVHVVEDQPGNGDMPATYVDVDGNRHYTTKIATLNRLDGDATITAPMVVDERDPWFGSGPEVVEARGNLASLDERLSTVIDDDGNLKPSAVEAEVDHSDLKNMPDTAVDPALAVADHDARYGNLTYSDGPGGGAAASLDNQSHRDAISEIAASAIPGYLDRIISWMNGS